jgi:UDP-N-acetylglucosamine/UDP-N-acetylgalactosamine 4-epimerase
MNNYEAKTDHLRRNPKTWLITGVGGFIGSHLLEMLLKLEQRVVGLDNFTTGHQRNLDEVRDLVSSEQWSRFAMINGDITDVGHCRRACNGVQYVLHHAAVGSVPGSIADPRHAHSVNVTGFVNVLVAAREAAVRRFIYASSSAVYGDDARRVKIESTIGECLSPYAVSKRSNELYARVFTRCYGIETIGLRYFNIFGARQDPKGPYAAVIPNWIVAMMQGKDVVINGDGETTRDFCYVADVVQANILAATCDDPVMVNPVFNIGRGNKTSLNELFHILCARLVPFYPRLQQLTPTRRDFRPGDIRHSQANIHAAQQAFGYSPEYTLVEGLDAALTWYRKNLS